MSYLWYIPNTVEPGHRGDDAVSGYGTLEHSVDLARTAEEHGWEGALIGTGWGWPDTFTVATAIAARTTTFKPLAAIRPGYWQPAHFASAAATLDHLSGGRLLVNIVSGKDNLSAYGDVEGDQTQRYARTKEFMRIVRRLWTEEDVTFEGTHFGVTGSTLPLLPSSPPRLYFGGASEAAERVSATEADVQLFWGEPLDGIADRDLPPLEFGLRITTLIRDTREQAWHDVAGRLGRRRAGGAGGVRGPGHHALRPLRHPLQARDGPGRRRDRPQFTKSWVNQTRPSAPRVTARPMRLKFGLSRLRRWPSFGGTSASMRSVSPLAAATIEASLFAALP